MYFLSFEKKKLEISYMELHFSLEIVRDVYRIKLRGDSSNVHLYVDDIKRNISVEKQCKFGGVQFFGKFYSQMTLLSFSVELHRSQNVTILPKDIEDIVSCSLPRDIIDGTQPQ